MLITLSQKFHAAGFPAVLCLLAVLFSIESAPAQAAEKLIFSIPSRSIAAIDLYIAKERGFFRGEGLDVDIVQIRGNVAIAAALSGTTSERKTIISSRNDTVSTTPKNTRLRPARNSEKPRAGPIARPSRSRRTS